MTLRKAKLMLWLLWGTLAAAILCLLVSLGAAAAGFVLRDKAYQDLLSISQATDIGQRRSTYLRAIRLYPDRPDGYLALLNAYGEDGSYTKAESDEFLTLYNANHLAILEEGKYQIDRQTGLLYMNGYEGTTTARLRMALPFLQNALHSPFVREEDRSSISCYCQIGAYYQDYIWNATSVKEITKQQMEALVEQMSQTLESFPKTADMVFDRLGFGLAVCDFLYNQRNILAGTVDQEKSVALLDMVYNGLPTAESLQREQTRSLLQQLSSNEEFYRAALKRAYERKEA